MTVFSASEEKPIEEAILHGKLYLNMPDALRIAGGDVDYGTRPGVQSHGLTINYRSVPATVEVANKLSGRTDKPARTAPSTLSRAFYVPYKKAEKDKLQGAFRSMVDTAAIAHPDAMILCRSADWVDEWRGGGAGTRSRRDQGACECSD